MWKFAEKQENKNTEGEGRTILFAGLGFNFKLANLNLWTDTYKYFQKNFLLIIIRLAKGFAIGSMAINLQEKMGLPNLTQQNRVWGDHY